MSVKRRHRNGYNKQASQAMKPHGTLSDIYVVHNNYVCHICGLQQKYLLRAIDFK